MKTALILEGGGMRGAYTCGITDFLLENNLSFDLVVGVSAGACHACSFISKQKKRSMRTYTQWVQDKRYMSIKNYVQTGDYFNSEFVYYDIPQEYDPFDFATFNNSKTKLIAVCTDCKTGKPLYMPVAHIQEDMEYIRASSSLPLISQIVNFRGFEMLDGGISDSIPYQYALDRGYDKIVIVRTQQHGYRKSENSLMPLIKARYKEYPYLIEALQNRHLMYNEQVEKEEQLEQEGTLFTFYPSEMNVDRLEKDPIKLKELYDVAISDANKQKEALLNYLNP